MIWLKNKFKLLDDILNDFLVDLKSLRYQLILAGYAFNVFIAKYHPEALVWSIGLLTAIYGLYFVSKHNQAVMENTKIISPTRDPDDIDGDGNE